MAISIELTGGAAAAAGTGADKSQPASSKSERPGNSAPPTPTSVDRESVVSALEDASQTFITGGRMIEFSFNDEINRVVVKVKSEDGEILRQIPPEDYMKFLAQFKEMIGVLFDATA